MFSTLHKKLVWAVVLWFAVMQTLSPLIHAHIEIDTPDQGHGIHMHMQEIVQKVPTFENVTKSLHTIGVNQALIKEIKLLSLPLFSVLFVLFLLITSKQHFNVNLNILRPLLFYLRPQSRPRAPPCF